MNLRFAAVVIVVLCLGVPSLESIGARAEREATTAECQDACSAASRGDDSVIRGFINQGIRLCKCNCIGASGGGILHVAAGSGCGLCIELLTINPSNCPCDDEDDDGNTPLHIAAGVCNIPITQRAITAGCNVNAVNDAGDTPICRAVKLSSDNCGAVAQDLDNAGAQECLQCGDEQTACGGCSYTNTCNVLTARGACPC